MSEKKWYAIYTRPRFEKKAVRYLEERHINSYLPLVKTLRKWSDRNKLVELPLFASYVFVKVDNTEYPHVLNGPGIVRYVCFEGKAVEIPESQIENIRWILSTDVKTEVVDESIPQGSLIEIIKGPLIGLRAEMITYNNKSRILVRLDQFEKSVEIQVPASHVKIIKANN
jgi:transcriptional antiterminator RfaH